MYGLTNMSLFLILVNYLAALLFANCKFLRWRLVRNWYTLYTVIVMQMFIAVINENFDVAEEQKRSQQASNYWSTHQVQAGKATWVRRLNPYVGSKPIQWNSNSKTSLPTWFCLCSRHWYKNINQALIVIPSMSMWVDSSNFIPQLTIIITRMRLLLELEALDVGWGITPRNPLQLYRSYSEEMKKWLMFLWLLSNTTAARFWAHWEMKKLSVICA